MFRRPKKSSLDLDSDLLFTRHGSPQVCHSPWFQLSPRDHYYYLVTEIKGSFHQVQDHCRSLGGRLASIFSKEDYFAIKARLGKYYLQKCSFTAIRCMEIWVEQTLAKIFHIIFFKFCSTLSIREVQ